MFMALYPEYKKLCRDTVVGMVQELGLNSIQEVATVPTEYPCTDSLL